MINNRYLKIVMDEIAQRDAFPYLERYRLRQMIGKGGMGVVYLADDQLLDRRVAVKIVRQRDGHPDSSNRLIREANIIAALEHPGIVPVHDVGKLDDGRVFYVMRLVDGEDLSEYIRQKRPIGDILRVFERICESVSFAHQNNIVHRDLKPQNIMLGRFGEVLILDWGIAKLLKDKSPASAELASTACSETPIISVAEIDCDRTQSLQTQNGIVIGTPTYMSPEASRGKTDEVDFSSDVFALGAILFEMLIGRKLINREAFLALADGQNPSLESARSISKKIPKVISAICDKAKSVEKENRYVNAEELRCDIRLYLNDMETSAYKSPIWEKVASQANRHQAFIWMILAYLILRITFAVLS